MAFHLRDDFICLIHSQAARRRLDVGVTPRWEDARLGSSSSDVGHLLPRAARVTLIDGRCEPMIDIWTPTAANSTAGGGGGCVP